MEALGRHQACPWRRNTNAVIPAAISDSTTFAVVVIDMVRPVTWEPESSAVPWTGAIQTSAGAPTSRQSKVPF